MYIIEAREIIGLYDETRLIARPDDITVVANEHDPYYWHGSMVIGKHQEEIKSVASRKGIPLLVTFDSKSGHYQGLIRITGGPRDVGKFYSLEFTGIDALISS